MISSNCSIKLLENVHIGLRIRMTSDKSTVPFKNVPLSKLKIANYTVQGFELSHEKLPKNIWVDFNQLPLTSLTIIDGVIQNELTFVENINRHQMELIKTDMLDYIELLHIKINESTKTFHKLSDLVPGDFVKSALCNGGADMIFVGVFYTKNIITRYNYRYGNVDGIWYKYFLSKGSPQRAIFLISDNSLTYKEKEELSFKHDVYYDDNYWRLSENEQTEFKKRENDKKREGNKILMDSPFDRFRLIDYPVTSKVIKNMVKLEKRDERFSDLDNNFVHVMNNLDRKHNTEYYRKPNTHHNENPRLTKILPIPITDESFQITSTSISDINFISTSKAGIDLAAIEFIKNNYNVKLDSRIYED